ncbi:MAG: UDP-2,3-diacylglucosamine diphosphatase [Cyclobacteriaceae bacterium]|nr:UDP-2,3-diacylglucosamine diphosphatase [Cyclobacteriaceae bacterium HetDA_MAG_MS6]
MDKTNLDLKPGEKIYFASDFHLGVTKGTHPSDHEKKITRWLDQIKNDAAGVFLVGDIFDFWFEYKHVVPKGFIRFQGKLAELVDLGIPVVLFTGNHDMWMFDYFPKHLGIPVIKNPTKFQIGQQYFLVGHGDGLGPGDRVYKILKNIFANKFCQWLFGWLHPNLGVALAKYWSSKSRISSAKSNDDFKGEKERLLQYCKQIEIKEHHDYYVFGHRHLPLELEVGESSTYFNLGEWVHGSVYLIFDGKQCKLEQFEG